MNRPAKMVVVDVDRPGIAEDMPSIAVPMLDPGDPIRSARELVGARLTDSLGRRLMHRHRGAFWQFRDGCYRLIEEETIRALIWTFLESASKLDGKDKIVPFKPTRAKVSDALDALGAVCELGSHVAPPSWLADGEDMPAAEEFLAVANGLLHLPSGELYPATPHYFGLNASEVVFNPFAQQPRAWLSFLRDLFGDDVQAIGALQEWFGYTLTADTSQQKILLMVGPPRSGKGTIARVHRAMIGLDSVAAPTLASLSSNFGLEVLIGKPLAIISDARLGARSDQAAIAERLLSISGEDALTIDRKFRSAWTGRLPTRFMLLTNELPRLADSSGALAKRFIILVLENSFYGKEDPSLTFRLLAELPGILNWAREGYEALYRRGHFLQPESASEAIADLETLSSPVTAFIRDKCAVSPGLQIATSLLYSEWKEWCQANGRKEPGTVQTFGRDLRAAFPSIKSTQPRQGEQRFRVYEGVDLQ